MGIFWEDFSEFLCYNGKCKKRGKNIKNYMTVPTSVKLSFSAPMQYHVLVPLVLRGLDFCAAKRLGECPIV